MYTHMYIKLFITIKFFLIFNFYFLYTLIYIIYIQFVTYTTYLQLLCGVTPVSGPYQPGIA